LREKVLAEAAEEFIIVADYRKNNMLLGQVSFHLSDRGTSPRSNGLSFPQSWTKGIPIETPPFAYSKGELNRQLYDARTMKELAD
jgi:ribose 5-phosphate isomerase A